MKNTWLKLGLLYEPSAQTRHPRLISHASNPLPVYLEGDVYRIFYSGRDSNNKSSVGAVDIDIVRRRIVNDYYHPFFEYGVEGSFYSSGVSIGNYYIVDDTRYILFMGWQTPHDGHWRGDIGRLVLTTDLTLQFDSNNPFMSSNEEDPISLSYPWVLKSDNGNYCMWYGSTISWDAGNGEMVHVLKYAFSNDGHTWDRKGLAIPYKIGRVQAFSRPTVVQNMYGDYEMWFSYRSGSGEKYRIGYARSANGEIWELELDNSGINVSLSGWDSEMIEYPFVFDHDGQRYMLYNGNEYGKTGFGLAVLKT